MTLASCPRLFEVEAARDGRLTGAELASFERHLGACAVCSREAEALEAPAAALRAGTAGKRDELHVRRERTRLLAAFDAELVGPRQGGRWRRWSIPIAAALLCGFVIWRARPFARERPVPSAVVRASNAAEWSEQTQGPLEKVELARGSLWLHVDHASNPGRRLLVILPDGELEDTGTTFTVSADGERTTRIEVQDGSVLLRRRGQLPVAIGAGGTWSPSPASALPNTPSAPSAPSAASAAEPIPPPSQLPPTRAIAPAPAVPAPSASEPAPRLDPSLEFRAAMTTFNGGDNAGAAAAFARFLAQHPRDPRAEDAAYLRVIALRRSGDAHAVKSAAQDYLRRYPAGFRRAEVETLSR
jgi:hypothetical protein